MRRRGALAGLGLLAGLAAVLVLPTPAAAWPAIQTGRGVLLCDSRPSQQPDGRWTCRSGGVLVAGDLVDVGRGWGPPPGRGPYSPYGPGAPPWGGPPPTRGYGGYDELDPWLGERRER